VLIQVISSSDRIFNNNNTYTLPPSVTQSSAISEKSVSLSPDIDFQELPRISEINKQHSGGTVPTVTNTITKKEREHFVTTRLPNKIRVMLDQPFGKDNLSQCFSAETTFRHVLLPLVHSSYLSPADWILLQATYPPAHILATLLTEYSGVDFLSFQGYPDSWDSKIIDQDRVKLATAALLHFEGDAASLVRWVGGPHTGAHRDVDATLTYLEGKIDPAILSDIERIFRNGIPNTCNASASEENFQSYLSYGNHSSIDEVPDKTYKSFVKDHARGYCLAFDERIVHFVLNCHITPGGLVNTDHSSKPARPIFDSSFRPTHSSYGINDWTNKATEPDILFANSFQKFLTWIYNLRITYPTSEIYPIDDDVTGAFRHCKYHPNVVAMHSYLRCGYLAMATGGTFGDNTTPSNWEAIALGRQQLAQYLWAQPDTLDQVKNFLPNISISAPPSAAIIASFTAAEADLLNTGVLDTNGKRRPPQYDHHVDDCLYAEVDDHLHTTVAASMLALFKLLGFPTDTRVPNPFSMEKFDTLMTHTRRAVGYHINTRRLTIGILPQKRNEAISLLSDWLVKEDFDLREIAALHGLLESLTRYHRWGRSWFFAIQNAIRHELSRRYYVVKRIYARKNSGKMLTEQLPPALHHRITSIIAQEQAQLLWNSRHRTPLTVPIRACLQVIHDYLTGTNHPWEESIGFIIPRNHHFVSIGDASKLGGGAHCDKLEYWFDILWSTKVRNGVTNLKPSDPQFVHINSLEFIVVIMQLAAAIVRLQTLSPAQILRLFPSGLPAEPVCLCLTDNTSSMAWANKVTSKSVQGQNLIGIFAELLRIANLGYNCEHLAGVLNCRADDISRPTFPYLSISVRHEQIFLKHACLRTWDYFLPSPELSQLLCCALFTKPSPDRPSLPKNLGRFAPVGFTTSCSPTV
jgi:hypothetical protein